MKLPKVFRNIPGYLLAVKIKDELLLKYGQPRDLNRLLNYSKIIKKDDLVFDIGANFGNYTKLFLYLGAKVIAVEPQSLIFSQLVEKFSDNPLFTGLQVGLGDKEDTLTIRINPLIPEMSTFSKEWLEVLLAEGRVSATYSNWADEEIVNIITLDHLINTYGKPHYIKIDVEGYELEVIQGLSEPINYLSFEFHSEFFEPVLKTLAHLQTLGEFKCNMVLNTKSQFASKSFLPVNDLLILIDHLSKVSLLSGDIFINFNKETL